MSAKIISQIEKHVTRYLELEIIIDGNTIIMDTEFIGVNCEYMIEYYKTDIWNQLTLEQKEEVRDAIKAYYPI